MAEYTDDLCSGGTVFSNGSWSDWYDYNAFNNSFEEPGWHHASFPAIIGYQFTESKMIQKYAISNRTGINQAPSIWTFEGSNNGSDWTELDSRLNITGWSLGETREFIFDNDLSFTYYRFSVTQTESGSNCSILEIGMMEKISNVNPNRPDTMSGLYTLGSRGNLRGKAAEGFIRPTIKQFFMSAPDYEEITSIL